MSLSYIQAFSSILLPLFGQNITLTWCRKPFMAPLPSQDAHSSARSRSHFSSLAQSRGWAESSKDYGQVWKVSVLETKIQWLRLKSQLPKNQSPYPVLVIDSEVTQSCPTLCDPMDCSLPGSSVHGIFQAIVLEWIAISFSRGSS